MPKKLIILALMHGDKGGSYKHLIKYLNHLKVTKKNNYLVITNLKYLKENNPNIFFIKTGNHKISPYLSIFLKATVSLLSNFFFNRIILIDFFNPIYLPSLAKQIAIIRDLGELKFKKYDFIRMFYRTKIMLPLTIKFSSHIIAISENTKKDLIDNFELKQTKIKTIYHGSDKFDERNIKFNKKDFFLYIGRIDTNGKNLLNLISAYDKYLDENGNHNLILAGKSWRNSHILYKHILSSKKLINKVSILDFVNQNEKDKLLLNAKALIYISKYEGFGHPILEAQAKGCNALCSDLNIMRDIAGNSAKFVNPNSIEEIKNGLLYYQNYNYDQLVFNNFKINLKRFDWEKNFSDYDEICFG